MILVLLGPPGSGKGTQAKKMQQELDLPHISVGDLLRIAVREKNAIGRQVESFMNQGKLVPDEISIALTKERISQPDCKKGFILDGFPRNLAQAAALEKMFAEASLKLDGVLYINVPLTVVVERLSGRRSCKSCGAVFHIKYSAPQTKDVCDKCGAGLYQRDDDKPETIKQRFEVYENSTKPLIDFYAKKNLLKNIDGSLDPEKVFLAVRQFIQA